MTPDQRIQLNRAVVALDAADRKPTADELGAAPVLDFWQPLLDPGKMPLLFGCVTKHPTLGSTTMTSSRLVAIDRVSGWARTISRWYQLERPFSEFEGEAIRESREAGHSLESLHFDFFPCVPINDPEVLDRLLSDYAELIRRIAKSLP